MTEETKMAPVVVGNLIDLDGGVVLSELPGSRLSLPGGSNSNSNSRRQSMNLMFTTDHKLRLSNNDAVSVPSAATLSEFASS